MMRSSGSVLWPTTIQIVHDLGRRGADRVGALARRARTARRVDRLPDRVSSVALTLQSAYYFGVWRRKPIRALHASPLADAEGERIEEAAAGA